MERLNASWSISAHAKPALWRSASHLTGKCVLVFPALCGALTSGAGIGPLQSQLVQSGRRRTRYGILTDAEYESFLREVVPFEHMLIGSGIQILKYWLDIGKKEQKRRLRDRRHDPLKQWKTSPIDDVALKHWDAYTEAAGFDVGADLKPAVSLDCGSRRRQASRTS
jgi:Polyphosphate kinase 2 (PPK2)